MPGALDVWYALVGARIGADERAALLAVLSDDERARLARRPEGRGRDEFLTAHALLRVALSRYADVAPADWRLASEPEGRPVVAGPAAGRGLHLSLSHTRGLAACAVTRIGPVGIDVEPLDRAVRVAPLADRVLAPGEHRDWSAQPAEERTRRLLEYWTLKEAHLKATGLGIRQPLRALEFRLLPDGRAALAGAEPGGRSDDWQHTLSCIAGSHVLATALAAPRPLPVRRHEWRPASMVAPAGLV